MLKTVGGQQQLWGELMFQVQKPSSELGIGDKLVFSRREDEAMMSRSSGMYLID